MSLRRQVAGATLRRQAFQRSLPRACETFPESAAPESDRRSDVARTAANACPCPGPGAARATRRPRNVCAEVSIAERLLDRTCDCGCLRPRARLQSTAGARNMLNAEAGPRHPPRLRRRPQRDSARERRRQVSIRHGFEADRCSELTAFSRLGFGLAQPRVLPRRTAHDPPERSTEGAVGVVAQRVGDDGNGIA